jgi:hypothetical protein
MRKVKEALKVKERLDELESSYNELQRKMTVRTAILKKQVETNERKHELIHGVGKVFTLEDKEASIYYDNTKLLNNVPVVQVIPDDTFVLTFYGVKYLLKVKKLAYAKSNLCELVSVDIQKECIKIQKPKDSVTVKLDPEEITNQDNLQVRLGEMTIQIDFALKTIDLFGPENEALITLTDTKIKSIKRKKREKDV